MKCVTALAVNAWLVLTILPTGLNRDPMQAIAQTATPSCPKYDIVAIWPRSLAVWLLVGSDQTTTTPVTIELTTEKEIAIYSVPAIVFAKPPGEAPGGLRSAPIALVTPLGNVLSASVQPVITGATCAASTRIVRVATASGVYRFAQRSDEDIAFEKVVMIEAQGADKSVALTSRRDAAPFDCRVAHRDALATHLVEPEYPSHARGLGQGGTVVIKVSLTATGAVRSVSIYKPSGFEELDQAGLAAARAATYTPEVVNCFTVDGTYLWRADWTPPKQQTTDATGS